MMALKGTEQLHPGGAATGSQPGDRAEGRLPWGDRPRRSHTTMCPYLAQWQKSA